MPPVDPLATIDTASVSAPVLSLVSIIDLLSARVRSPVTKSAMHRTRSPSQVRKKKARTRAGLSGERDGRDQRCFSESRISRSSTMSSGVAAGAASAGLRSLLMNFTIRKMMKARMMKLISTVMNEP